MSDAPRQVRHRRQQLGQRLDGPTLNLERSVAIAHPVQRQRVASQHCCPQMSGSGNGQTAAGPSPAIHLLLPHIHLDFLHKLGRLFGAAAREWCKTGSYSTAAAPLVASLYAALLLSPQGEPLRACQNVQRGAHLRRFSAIILTAVHAHAPAGSHRIGNCFARAV